jgi:hypothetical protein
MTLESENLLNLRVLKQMIIEGFLNTAK